MTSKPTDSTRSFEIEHDTTKEVERMTPAEGAPTPTEKKTPKAGTRRRRQATKAERQGPVEPEALPFPLRPAMLVLLGALLVVLAWLGYQNPVHGLHQGLKFWPWETFRSDLGAGGEVVFRWDSIALVSLGGAALALLLVIGSILRSSPKRGAYLFVVAGLGVILFWKDVVHVGDASTLAMHVVGALTAGAVLLRQGLLAGRTGRALLLALLVVLLGLVFFPRPMSAGAGYNPLVLELLRPLGAFVELPGATMPELGTSIGFDRIWSADGLHVIGLVLLLVFGLVTLFGLRGPWTVWIATGLVLLTTLVPPAAVLLADAPLTGFKEPDVLAILGSTGWSILASLAVILVAGLLSLLGIGGRWTMGVAGVGLGLLTLVVASRHFVLGLDATSGVTPFYAGLAGMALWLGPGPGALLAPLAAGILDQRARG